MFAAFSFGSRSNVTSQVDHAGVGAHEVCAKSALANEPAKIAAQVAARSIIYIYYGVARLTSVPEEFVLRPRLRLLCANTAEDDSGPRPNRPIDRDNACFADRP